MTEDKDKIVEGQNLEEPTFTNDEINDKTIEELLGDDEDEVVAVKEPETPTPVTPEPPKQPETPPAPALDAEKLKEDLRKEISQTVAQQVVEALSGGKKEEEEKYPWEAEGRNPSYKEALDYVKDKAAEKVKADFAKEAEDTETRERQEAEAKHQQETQVRTAWDNYWDGQLAELESAGRIPKMTNPNDPKDPGRKARLDLFSKMQAITNENLKQGKPAVMNIKEVYYEHFASRPTPPGMTAPVHGSRRAVQGGGEKDSFTNDEIRRSSLEDILLGK